MAAPREPKIGIRTLLNSLVFSIILMRTIIFWISLYNLEPHIPISNLERNSNLKFDAFTSTSIQSLSIKVECAKTRRYVENNNKMCHTRCTSARSIWLLHLLLSGDIHMNPGPSIYPCGFCELPVTWQHQRAICCDECDIWYHSDCLECNESKVDLLQHQSISWICCKCDSQNVNSFTFHSFELELSNQFSILSLNKFGTNMDIEHIDSPFIPNSCSSPKKKHQRSTSFSSSSSELKDDTIKQPDYPNLRFLVVNCQSIKNKTPELQIVVDYVRPDIIIGTESWLSNDHRNSEFFPDGYHNTVYRKDRNKDGGGVFISVREGLVTSEVDRIKTNCETVWCELHLKNKRTMFIGAYYRPPSAPIEEIQELRKTLEQLPQKSRRSITLLAGDFNMPDIDWNDYSLKENSRQTRHHQELLDIINENCLEQLQEEPTRNENILDLVLTNVPSLVKNCKTIPGISDHDMIVIDHAVHPSETQTKRRTLYQFKKANWENIKEKTRSLSENIFRDNINEQSSVDENWNKLKNGINEIIQKEVPTKLSPKRRSLPWINHTLKKMIRKKKRLYRKAKKSGQKNEWENYRNHQKNTQKEIRKEHWKFVNNILDESLKNNNSKPFWRYIKNMKNDNIGIAPIKNKGELFLDNKTKAKLLNEQFQSVFTREQEHTEIPKINGKPSPAIDNLHIDCNGVEKLLTNLNISKASGPDNIPNVYLKTCAKELSTVLTFIFRQSFTTGQLPEDWRNANITPIYKKGNKHEASNYRPVSLTSVCCKLMEHIICKHILNHLEKYNIITTRQHGFRSKRSCESQLLITMNDIMQNYDNKIQTDLIILDFSKAFDTVPHRKLLSKLQHYGIDGNILNWIKTFLTDRKQRVVIGGEQSDAVKVDSGVPQGTVLGPLLFLCHINDLPEAVQSETRLFADDSLLYRQIHNEEDQIQLQKDLVALQKWAEKWGMNFNTSKCYVMSIARSRKPLQHFYELNDHILKQVKENPYLGITISDNLKWSKSISKTLNKASSTLGFLKRNLFKCPKKLKETAYISLVRSTLDYSATVWDPYLEKDINQLERINRRGARFVMNDNNRTSSVTSMLQTLEWTTLQQRRREQRLIMMYKIISNLVEIPANNFITPNKQRTRRKNSKTLNHIRCNTEIYKNSFFPRTVIDWNKLTEECVTADSVDSFKCRVRKITWD